MEDFFFRFLYLIANSIAVIVLACLVDEKLVLPIVCVWILTEIAMVQRKLEKKEEKKDGCVLPTK